MAKQDAVTIHPRDAEKDDTANGTCKDKQLKVPDLVDVAGLAIRDTPSSGRQHNSPDLGHCTSPQAVALNVQHTIRKQDQLQRLVHLEKSHRDTALVISQLQDQVQRLAENCAHQKKDQLQLRQEKDQKVLRASDESGPNEVEPRLQQDTIIRLGIRSTLPVRIPRDFHTNLNPPTTALLITTSTTKKHWIVPEIPTNARAHPTSRSNLLRNPIVITTLFNTNGIKSNKHMQDSSKTTSWRYPLITLFMINLFVAENGAAA
ncbi:hypothetical protein BGX23_010239 [Mortierella sp. AD031]|nr:hypothetical protein BGX23_010239 [Mortierella sp. AD031]